MLKRVEQRAKAAGLYMICTISKHAAERKGYADAMMLDWQGRVAECTGANIFFVKEGKLFHAAWGSLVGHEALCAILDAQDGVFRTTPLPDDVVANIHTNWQYALMEAVRILDERANSSPRQTGSFPAIRVEDSVLDKMSGDDHPSERRGMNLLVATESRKSPRPGGAASSLVDKGFAALRAGKVEEARKCWQAAKELDPDNRSLDLNLKKLESKATR